MRKVMTGFNHQMKDGVSDASREQLKRQMNSLPDATAQGGGRARGGGGGRGGGDGRGGGGGDYDDDEYFDEGEESSFAPSRVRNASERAYLQDVAEDDEEFDEQVSDAVRQYQRDRRGAPSKHSAPARAGRGRNGYAAPTKGGASRRGGSSAPSRRRASAGGGRRAGPWDGGSDDESRGRGGRSAGGRRRGGVRGERSDPTMGGGSYGRDRAGGESRSRGGAGNEGGVDIERHKQRVEELKNQVRKLQSDIPNLMKDYERQRRGKEDTDRKLQSLERQLKERTKELSIRESPRLCGFRCRCAAPTCAAVHRERGQPRAEEGERGAHPCERGLEAEV